MVIRPFVQAAFFAPAMLSALTLASKCLRCQHEGRVDRTIFDESARPT
jgi:hypothetical protein